MQKTFQSISIPKLPVFTTEEGIKHIRNNLESIKEWKDIMNLIPKFYSENKMKRTGIAGIFAASLELTKEGIISLDQKKLFDQKNLFGLKNFLGQKTFWVNKLFMSNNFLCQKNLLLLF